MLEDAGNMELAHANDANIPVSCFLYPPDESTDKWKWTASNFMPRKGYCSEDAYELHADTKEEIIEVVHKYVLPLYQAAIDNLREKGENYYWGREA